MDVNNSKIVLLETLNCTPVHLCTMHMYISNMDSIPGILHVTVIFFTFHIYISYFGNTCFITSYFTHTYILCLIIKVVSLFQMFISLFQMFYN